MKKNLLLKKGAALLALVLVFAVVLGAFAPSVYAQTEEAVEKTAESVLTGKAYASALVIGLAALAGAFAMGMAISKAADGISRQPEAEGQIRGTLMLGLVFIETVVIYALIVAILIIFVL